MEAQKPQPQPRPGGPGPSTGPQRGPTLWGPPGRERCMGREELGTRNSFVKAMTSFGNLKKFKLPPNWEPGPPNSEINDSSGNSRATKTGTQGAS